MERAAILCDGLDIEPQHLRLGGAGEGGPTLGDLLDLSGPLAEVLGRVSAKAEEEAILLALKACGRDRAAAAERLGISPGSLGKKLKALGLDTA